MIIRKLTEAEKLVRQDANWAKKQHESWLRSEAMHFKTSENRNK